jgi:hypothetical protein
MAESFAGIGKKRPQLNIPSEKLLLDPENPRLPLDVQGSNQEKLMYSLYKDFDLRELAESLSQNGYFDEEPLVAIPKDLPAKFKDKSYEELNKDEEYFKLINNKDTKFIVVEGNRRIATVKILLSDEIKTELKIKEWPELSEPIIDDISSLPVIIYPKRKDVVPYLGVRHIIGIKKWEPYAKARYIAGMIGKGFSLDEIQKSIGDRGTSTRKSYVCYKLIEIMEEEEEGSTDKAKSVFSYLLLSLGQGAIKEYLGINKKWSEVDVENPISPDKIPNLKNLFSYLFGEGKEKLAVIKESRDITGKLTHVLRIKETADYLFQTRDLDAAYDRSDGEEKLVIKKITAANRSLENALGIVHRHKTEQVVGEVKKCKETLNQISKILEE